MGTIDVILAGGMAWLSGGAQPHSLPELPFGGGGGDSAHHRAVDRPALYPDAADAAGDGAADPRRRAARSEEHTSEFQSLMRSSYAVFCLKKKKKNTRIKN